MSALVLLLTTYAMTAGRLTKPSVPRERYAQNFSCPAPSSGVLVGGAFMCRCPDGTYASIDGCDKQAPIMTPIHPTVPTPAMPQATSPLLASPVPPPQAVVRPPRNLVSCDDPRVKDALILAIMQRYKNLFSGVQVRELGWIGAGHAGFAPNGDNICKAWVNFQTFDGRVLLAGTAQFEVQEDSSGNIVASLL